MLLKSIVSVLMLLASVSPALADVWAIQRQNATQCDMRYGGDTAPIAPDNYPTGAACVPFVPQNGDNEVVNYRITNGVLVYAPGGVLDTSPNPLQAKQLIQADANIPGLAQVAMLPYVSVINDYPTNTAGSKAAWGAMKQVAASGNPAFAWLTSAVIAAIESDCAQANMPLN